MTSNLDSCFINDVFRTKAVRTGYRAPNRLRVLRAGHNFSQWDVAHALGISQSLYSLIELGRRDVEPAERKKLARLFRVAETDIFPEVA